MSGAHISIAELIKAIRDENWDLESANIAAKHLFLNSTREWDRGKRASWFSGQWFQATDYLQSLIRDDLRPPVKLAAWEQQLINSRHSYK